MKHTLHDNILGEIDYEGIPYRWVFVYGREEHGDVVTFENVLKMQAMKTGCYVLHCLDGVVVSVAPGHRYTIQSPMDKE